MNERGKRISEKAYAAAAPMCRRVCLVVYSTQHSWMIPSVYTHTDTRFPLRLFRYWTLIRISSTTATPTLTVYSHWATVVYNWGAAAVCTRQFPALSFPFSLLPLFIRSTSPKSTAEAAAADPSVNRSQTEQNSSRVTSWLLLLPYSTTGLQSADKFWISFPRHDIWMDILFYIYMDLVHIGILLSTPTPSTVHNAISRRH